MQRNEIVLISFLTEILGKQVVILQNEANKLWDKIPLYVHSSFFMYTYVYGYHVNKREGRIQYLRISFFLFFTTMFV